MSKLKKLVVNGETYTVSDEAAVVFNADQVLTNEQKAQARKNIDAALVVTFTPNWEEVYDPDNEITMEQIVSYTADTDYYDIATAFAEGIVVIAKWSNDGGTVWNVACGGYADQEFPHGKVGPFVYDAGEGEDWHYVDESADLPSGGSGGSAEWTDIVTDMLTGEVATLTIDADSNGEAFSFSELYMIGSYFGHQTDNTQKAITVYVQHNGSWQKLAVLKVSDYTRAIHHRIRFYECGGYYEADSIGSGANVNPEFGNRQGITNLTNKLDASLPITGIRFSLPSGQSFHTTTKVSLRGR